MVVTLLTFHNRMSALKAEFSNMNCAVPNAHPSRCEAPCTRIPPRPRACADHRPRNKYQQDGGGPAPHSQAKGHTEPHTQHSAPRWVKVQMGGGRGLHAAWRRASERQEAPQERQQRVPRCRPRPAPSQARARAWEASSGACAQLAYLHVRDLAHIPRAYVDVEGCRTVEHVLHRAKCTGVTMRGAMHTRPIRCTRLGRPRAKQLISTSRRRHHAPHPSTTPHRAPHPAQCVRRNEDAHGS